MLAPATGGRSIVQARWMTVDSPRVARMEWYYVEKEAEGGRRAFRGTYSIRFVTQRRDGVVYTGREIYRCRCVTFNQYQLAFWAYQENSVSQREAPI